MTSPNITNNAVFTALGDFLSVLFDCDIIKGEVNLVSMPQGSFILMNDVGKRRISQNHPSYSIDGNQQVKTPTQYDIQLDFYGADAGEMSQTFLMLWNDGYAYDHLPASIKPLYCDDLKQISLITGEENYLERWTTTAHIQYNPAVTVPVNLIEDIPVYVKLANGKVIS